ncbi:hypothetical protein [Pseudomonas fildesensis]|uniref:Uncharacterized protein n=1 Tax=Pseudomonas fildesensis TaxID=1674920 RepID=A0A0J8ISY2_9PSED|nr:hypothetical protein [Pseudomonas fildesensis]KMT54866.1 hypothetical protein ACR52_13830 [Pseudomonas fildesensis]
MKIRITEAFSDQGTSHVKFHSHNGSGRALWNGTAPKIGEIVDVEIDLDEAFSWGKNITPSSSKTPQITVLNGTTQITAELMQGADEKCAALQLGDSIILIELDGPIAQKSGFVEVKATRIQLYPTNI